MGTPRVWTGGGWRDLPLDKRLALLTHLACADAWVTREHLSYLFWPDVPTAHARINLRQLLARTRALPFPADIEADDQRLRLLVESDVLAFRRALAAGEWPAAVKAYEGELAQGLEIHDAVEFASWLEFERTQLREAFRQAALGQADVAVSEGRMDEAARILGALHDSDPLDESVVQRRLRLYVGSGAHGEARRLFDMFAAVMKEELGLPPSAATEAILIEPAGPVPANAPNSRRSTNFKEPLTSFVGRNDELATITTRLTADPCRLLTLLGPGGTGKTRLALRAAAALADNFEDGAYLVQLAPVVDPRSFPMALAAALDVDVKGATPPLQQVAGVLGERQVLLVLDQFEHIADAAVSLSEVLSACPGVRCLITSRERLRLEGEWLLPIDGLEVPDEGLCEPRAASSYPAMELLVDRARQVDPHFSVTPETVGLAVELCRAVDGLPLGIELAAGSLRNLSLKETVDVLRTAPGGLATDAIDVPLHHHSLRATFDHSWRHLGSQERTALARVSVFVGDFDNAAATSVTGATLPILASLVDKSLLRLSPDGRYDVHPVIRELAWERLEADASDLERTKKQHTAYYLHLLGAWKGRVHSAEQVNMLEQIGSEYANLRLAWLEALGRAWVAECTNGIDPLVFFHGIQGRFLQGAELFSQSVAELERAPGQNDRGRDVLTARVLADQAWFESGMANFDEAVSLARKSLRLIEPFDEPSVEVRGRQVLGSVAARRGDYDSARVHLRAGLDAAKGVADAWAIGLLAGQLGLLELRVGDLERAASHFSLALEVNEEMGNKAGVVNDLDYLGRLALQRGDTEAAIERFDRALALAEESRFHLRLAYLRLQMGVVLHLAGALAEATEHARAALTAADEHQQRAIKAEALLLLGRLTAESERAEERAEAAAHMFGALEEAKGLGEDPLLLAAILELTLLHRGVEAPARLRLVASHPAAQSDVRERARQELGAVTATPADLDETVTALLASASRTRGYPHSVRPRRSDVRT